VFECDCEQTTLFAKHTRWPTQLFRLLKQAYITNTKYKYVSPYKGCYKSL